MATTETSGRRKASKRPLPAAAQEPAANGPVQANELTGAAAKKAKLHEPATSKTKVKKENDVTISHTVNDSENHDKENLGTKQVLVFNWTSEELAQLITNLSACLPRNDNVKYTTLIDKLDWEKVRFGQYTAAQCKDKWMQIVTKLRRFRTLTDMVTDAKAWLKHPWSSYSCSKKQKHPEMPKKPLTPYFRYFLEKREKYSKDNPEMSMTDLAKLLSKKFQQLPEKKKQKYREAYEKENEGYKQELDKFKKNHPDQFPTPELKNAPASTEGPDKPLNAFHIFVNDRIKKTEFSEIDRREAMDKLRKLWSNLSDTKKVKWIRKACQEEQRYGAEVEKYRVEHPDFHPEPLKAVLSKAEKELKDRCDGKPERPPNSGYSLFSRIKLRELKDLPSKSKMGEISRMWKTLSDAERESLNKQAQIAIAKYKQEFAAYLSSLPDDERVKLENEMKPASKKKPVNNHIVIETVNNDVTELEAIDGARPKKPLSAMFYYQQEKFAVAQQKHPEMSKQNVMKLLAKDYNDLPEKKKDKYKKIAEEAKKAYDDGSTSKGKHETGGKRKLFKGEPKRPPQSGYGLFSSEKLSELTHVDPKNRMTEIAKLWKTMTTAEKDQYAKRVQELMRKYNKDMQKFLKGLTVAEFQEYEKYRKNSMKKKSKKGSEVVAIKKETESDSSDNDSSDDDDDSDKSDGEESGSRSGSGSGSSSGSDDSGSDSGSDDDDDDDDDEDDDDDDDDEDDEKKEGDDNDSSSSDSDSDSDSGSDSGSGSDDSSDSGSDKSDNDEKSS